MHLQLSILKLLFITGGLLTLLLSGPVAAEIIEVRALSSPPVLDGDHADWADVRGTVTALHKSGSNVTVDTRSVLVKGGVYGEYVYFCLEWDDSSEDSLHKPWVWDSNKKKYVKSKKMEDRLALQFVTGGDYTTNWLSGNEFTADMWHWKASRTNPSGHAHDKSTEISREKLLKSYKGVADDGKPVYIKRPSDKGDKLYTSKRYKKYVEDVMPKYILAESPKGSVADVEAKGVWNDGKWYLEIRRKLDTGNPGDVVFKAGDTVSGGIAVFNHTGDDNHAISDVLTFKF